MLRGISRQCIFLSLLSLLLLAPSAVGVAAEGVTIDKVALVTPASRTNQGWDQQAADAITKVAAERGIAADSRRMPGTTTSPRSSRILRPKGAS